MFHKYFRVLRQQFYMKHINKRFSFLLQIEFKAKESNILAVLGADYSCALMAILSHGIEKWIKPHIGVVFNLNH